MAGIKLRSQRTEKKETKKTEALEAPTASRQYPDETSAVRPLEKYTAPKRVHTFPIRSHSPNLHRPVLAFPGNYHQIFTLEGEIKQAVIRRQRRYEDVAYFCTNADISVK